MQSGMVGGASSSGRRYNRGGLGRHIIAELYGCKSEVLGDAGIILQLLTDAAVQCGAKVVGRYVEKFEEGGGVSAIVVIKESHISIHTWPEAGYAALDIFTCGEGTDPWKAYDLIIEKIAPENVSSIEIHRGLNVLGNITVKAEARASWGVHDGRLVY